MYRQSHFLRANDGATSAAHDKLTLSMLPAAVVKSKGARCLDGTAAGFYYALGNGTDRSRWVVWLDGGGECDTHADCVARARTEQGSSEKWRDRVDGAATAGICGRIAKRNEYFHSWSMIYIPYCSGDDWLGTMKRACDAWTEGSCAANVAQSTSLRTHRKLLFHAGHNIIEGTLDHAEANLGLRQATELLISGGSAGGQGAYYHADWLADRYPTKTVRSAPEYGWFGQPFSTYGDWAHGRSTNSSIPYPSPASNTGAPAWIRRVQPYIAPRCARTVHDMFQCTSVPTAYRATRTPTMVSNNAFDAFTLDAMGGIPSLKGVHGDSKLWHYVQYVGAQLRNSVLAQVKAEDGVFLTSCVDHQMAWASSDSATGPYSPNIGGCTHNQAVAAWTSGNGQCARLAVDSSDALHRLKRQRCNAGAFT